MLLIDPKLGTIEHDARKCRLSKKLMKLFLFLYQHRNKNVSRDAILTHLYLYEHDEPHEKIIDVFVCHMRKQLSLIGMEIETVWGFGYRLNTEVKATIIGSVE